jgi:hypothetical protein
MKLMTTPSFTFGSSPGAPLFGTTPEAASLSLETRAAEVVGPNSLVRWAFYLSVFTIPLTLIYLPGTGGRIGVLRVVQLLILCGIFSQPRVCLRFFPTALFWFLGYAGLRIVWGLWLTPEMSAAWWPSSREFLEFIPWLWMMFNVLQFPDARRGGLWALGLGCSLCALCHLAGIGVTLVPDSENRSSVFGLHANALGADYATAMTALLGLWMLRPRTSYQRLLPFPMILLMGIGLAKTGSRSALLDLAMGVLVLLFFGKAFGPWLNRAAALAMLGAVVCLTLWRIPTVLDRFDEINPQNIGQENPRARMAPVLWEMFLRSPLYGLGPDGYQWELTRRALPYLIRQKQLIAAHNLVLLLLVETGIIGLVMFSTGLGKAVVAAWRARLKPCGPLPLALLLPFAIGGATLCDPSHFPAFWLALAYALAGVA